MKAPAPASQARQGKAAARWAPPHAPERQRGIDLPGITVSLPPPHFSSSLSVFFSLLETTGLFCFHLGGPSPTSLGPLQSCSRVRGPPGIISWQASLPLMSVCVYAPVVARYGVVCVRDARSAAVQRGLGKYVVVLYSQSQVLLRSEL